MTTISSMSVEESFSILTVKFVREPTFRVSVL
jgi:hypothetical protein